MAKIRVLSDQIANQIAAGEVVERPASVAKELIENSIDAGARRIEVDTEAGGRRLLRITDDGEGMTRDDAILAFERHATSKISTAADLHRISTLGFRGEALASIASVARVELVTQVAGGSEATRVAIEGGRIRDVAPAAHPRGTRITVRDLFFNIPARRKFLRSEATESFHLTNLVMHYALSHPEIAFVLTSNGRETLRAASAVDLRERIYQIFGAEFLNGLLEITDRGGDAVARVRGYISAPRERRTSRDAQYLFVNGRFVRDRLISRALSEGYRSVLPPGVYPAALLFLEVPLEEVDVNVHPAKTEVRFRRSMAVGEAVREAVRATLASGGYVRPPAAEDMPDPAAAATTTEPRIGPDREAPEAFPSDARRDDFDAAINSHREFERGAPLPPLPSAAIEARRGVGQIAPPRQEAIEFTAPPRTSELTSDELPSPPPARPPAPDKEAAPAQFSAAAAAPQLLPPLVSAAGLVREAPLAPVAAAAAGSIRPLGQLDDSFIIATDADGLLLIDQHAAHERILFEKYRALEHERPAESQQLLMPETFDLTPAQVAAFDEAAAELETYGFGLMRLSGRTVAIKAVPADLPPNEAHNLLAELLGTIDPSKHGAARAALHDQFAAALARRAAVRTRTALTHEKMCWLIDRLLETSSPTTSPRGRPVILRLTTRDLERYFDRS